MYLRYRNLFPVTQTYFGFYTYFETLISLIRLFVKTPLVDFTLHRAYMSFRPQVYFGSYTDFGSLTTLIHFGLVITSDPEPTTDFTYEVILRREETLRDDFS